MPSTPLGPRRFRAICGAGSTRRSSRAAPEHRATLRCRYRVRPFDWCAQTGLLELATRLPAGSLFANLPQGLAAKRAMRVNELIAELVEEHGLVLVDLWASTGPPWEGKFSADHFHPNDAGYEEWTAAFRQALGITRSPQ